LQRSLQNPDVPVSRANRITASAAIACTELPLRLPERAASFDVPPGLAVGRLSPVKAQHSF